MPGRTEVVSEPAERRGRGLQASLRPRAIARRTRLTVLLPNLNGSSILLVAGAAALAATWPIFVFTGSQAGFVLATAASCLIAARLAIARTPVVLTYLLGVLAIIGPDANGPLGAGRPWLGSLRIFDLTVLAAALATAWVIRHDGLWRLRAPQAGWVHALATLGVLYGVARWLTVGHPGGPLLRTDARLIAIAMLVAFIAWRGVRGRLRPLLDGIVVIGFLAALKAAAIHLSGAIAIGEYDRLQTTSFISAGRLRTILIGGDTLLILVPATALLLACAGSTRTKQAALAVAGAASLGALSVSDSRTTVLVAIGLTVLTALAWGWMQHIRPGPRTVLAVVAAGTLVLGVVLASGVGNRLTHADAPHVGLNFREDEIRSFLRLPAENKLLGQGLGGAFFSKDVNGHPVLAGWAHELPVWLALKDGVFGLLAAAGALAVILGRAVRRRDVHNAEEVLAGCAYVFALVLMSMTIDRVALVEGLVALILAVRLISSSSPGETVA